MERNLESQAYPSVIPFANGTVENHKGYSKYEQTTIAFVSAMLSNPRTQLDSEESLEAVVHKAGELAKLVLNAF